MEKILTLLTNFFKNKALINFIFYTIPVHLIGIVSLTSLIYNGSYEYLMQALAFYFLFGCIGMAVGLHRYWSHASFTMPKWKERVMTTLGVFNGYGSIFPWVMIHEPGHHKHSDTDLDPHTPNKGFWHSFLLWHKNQDEFDRVVDRRVLVTYIKRGLVNDKYYTFLNDNHIKINALVLLFFYMLDPAVAFYGFALGVWFTLLNTSLVTALSHKTWFGYRSFDTKDNSVNNRLGAILTWGEMLHNNHHRHWRSTSNSRHWSEIDISGLVISGLKE